MMTAQDTPIGPFADGRDEKGRFTKGNPGGPGNPFSAKVAALRKALIDAVSEADVKGVIAALIVAARGGDVAAAKLLLTYSVGRPPEIDTDDAPAGPQVVEVRIDGNWFGNQNRLAAIQRTNLPSGGTV